jgi:hypothetical protein
MRTKFITLMLLLFAMVLVSGCGKESDSYYPLNEGQTWEYQRSGGSMLGPGGTQKIVITNLPERELAGKKVTPRKIDIGGMSAFSFILEDSNGICVFASQKPSVPEPKIEPNPSYILRNPVKAGTTWQEQDWTRLLQENIPLTLTSTIEGTDETVTVPAGTFKNCVKVKCSGNAQKRLGFFGDAQITVEQYTWFAPGVGMIKSMIKESSNHMMVGSGEMALQLESFKKQ